MLDGFGLALPDFAGIIEIVSTAVQGAEMILGEEWTPTGGLLCPFELLRGEFFNGETPEELFRDITTGVRTNNGENDLEGNSSRSPTGSRRADRPIPVRLGSRFSDPAQGIVEGLLCRKVSERLGGTKKGGTFGLRFHAFFAKPTLPGDKDGQLAKLAAEHLKGKGWRTAQER